LSRESFRRHRTVTIDDPNDSPSAIDVAHVVQGHYSRYVLYRVVAHERWNSGALEGGRIIFSFNTDNDADVERRTIREYKGGAGAQFRLRIENVTGAGTGELCYVVPVAACGGLDCSVATKTYKAIQNVCVWDDESHRRLCRWVQGSRPG